MAVIVFMPDCAYPRWTSAVLLPQNIFILVLFVDFYIKAYVQKPTQKANGHGNRITKENGHKNGHKNGHGPTIDTNTYRNEKQYFHLDENKNVSVDPNFSNGIIIVDSKTE